jgi:hypothetical protein
MHAATKPTTLRALHARERIRERNILAAPGLVNDHMEDTLRWE